MEENRTIIVDKYEYGLLITALNEYRTKLLREGKSTEFVNEFLLRLIDTPIRRRAIFQRERVSCER